MSQVAAAIHLPLPGGQETENWTMGRENCPRRLSASESRGKSTRSRHKPSLISEGRRELGIAWEGQELYILEG